MGFSSGYRYYIVAFGIGKLAEAPTPLAQLGIALFILVALYYYSVASRKKRNAEDKQQAEVIEEAVNKGRQATLNELREIMAVNNLKEQDIDISFDMRRT
jgi:hypothetical protein